jgi:hypothetical protein
LFDGLFDDAALFPPAGLTMSDAVTGHLRHQTAWYAPLSGPFVCPDAKLAELGTAMTATGIAELDLALVLPGGAASLDAAVDAVFADPRLRLRAVELPAGPAAEAAGPADVIAALDQTPLAGAAAFVELTAAQLTGAAARSLADHRYLAKLRTGGASADAFPYEKTMATCLSTLAAERLPFKCTAGLHHAVRHRAADTGFEHHGFLNVLLAAGAALDGASTEQIAAELADTDAAAVAARISLLDADAAGSIRQLFTSFGTCSTDEPVTDLVTLGLISQD